MQLEFSVGSPFKCHNKITARDFEECKTRPSFISSEQINDYINRGFVNFKLVGRGLPLNMVIDSYVYYLVKDEHKEYIRGYINETLESIRKAQMQRR